MSEELTGSAGTILVEEYGCWLTVTEAAREFAADRIQWGVWGPRLMKRLLDGDVKAAVETLTAIQSGKAKSGSYQRVEQWVWANVSPGSAFLKLSEADSVLPYSPESRSVHLTLRGIRLCDTDISRMLGRYVTSDVELIPLNRRRFVTKDATDGVPVEDLADDWLIRAVMKTGAEGGISDEDLDEVTERVARERAAGELPTASDFDEGGLAELTKRLARRRGEGPYEPMGPAISPEQAVKQLAESLTGLAAARAPRRIAPPYRARGSTENNGRPRKVAKDELRQWFPAYQASSKDFRTEAVRAAAEGHFGRPVTRQPVRDIIAEFDRTLTRGKPTPL